LSPDETRFVYRRFLATEGDGPMNVEQLPALPEQASARWTHHQVQSSQHTRGLSHTSMMARLPLWAFKVAGLMWIVERTFAWLGFDAEPCSSRMNLSHIL
jgi:hypothetical protein